MRPTSLTTHGLAGTLALAAGALNVAGCTAFVNDLTDHCNVTADCEAKGDQYAGSVCRDGLCRQVETNGPGPGGPDWSCVGRVMFAPAPEISVPFNVTTIDPVSGAPIPGLSVRPCGRVDSSCTNPITEAVITNGLGTARLNLPTVQATQGVPGFTGYLEVTGGDRSSYLYFTNPLTVERSTVLPIGSPASAEGFIQSLGGFLPDPTLAAGALIAKDCQGTSAPGIVAKVPEGGDQVRYFYVAGVAPSPSATATDPSGIVFIFNIPIGNVTFEMYRADNNAKIGQLSVLTRMGYSSLVEMQPTPL